MPNKLAGKRIAFLATDGYEEDELNKPWTAIKAEGAIVELISLKKDDIQGEKGGNKSGTFTVDKLVSEVYANDYDGLVLPGGVGNPDKLRMHPDAIAFVKNFFEQGKPVAAICHGPWMLVEAGVVNGRTLTSWPSIRTDIVNAGGNWVDEQVHVDNGMVTSRKPADLDAFCKKAIEEFAEGHHMQQAA